MSLFSKIDELEFNKAIKGLTNEQYRRLITKKLPEPNKEYPIFKIESCKSQVRTIISNLNLEMVQDLNLRAEYFILYCLMSNYAEGTTKLYFKNAQNAGLFGNSKTVPNYTHFKNCAHTRLIDETTYKTYCQYLFNHVDSFHAPILMCVYTATRNFEIRKLDTQSLHMLLNKLPEISIIRKDTRRKKDRKKPLYWRPVYSKAFNNFILQLKEIFIVEYENFLKNKINVLLFHMSKDTLISRVAISLRFACNQNIPHGFGIQGLRNTFGSIIAKKSNDISTIQRMFQHASSTTTKLYIKQHWTEIREGFNKFTKEYNGIVDILEKKL